MFAERTFPPLRPTFLEALLSSTEPSPNDPPSGVARVAIHGHFFEAEWINIFHVFITPHVEFSLADLTTLADNILTSYSDNVVQPTSEGNVCDYVDGVAWDDDGAHDYESAIDGGRGTDANNAIAAGTALLCNWRTDTHYRGGHPRTYMCGLTQEMLETTTLLTDDTVTLFGGAFNAFLVDVNTMGFGAIDSLRLGHVAFWRHHVALSPPLFFPFLSGRVRRELASQRRRQ